MSVSEQSTTARVTLQDIAREAGVSRATVSLILSNRTDYVRQFRPETVTRVRAVAEKLGYEDQPLAASRRSLRASFFALVLRGAQGSDVVAWQHQVFEGAFVSGVLAKATEAHIYPVVATQVGATIAEGTSRLHAVLDGGVFGAIVRSPTLSMLDTLRRREARGLPIVAVFPDHPTRHESNMLDMDNRAAGHLAGQLLAEAGRLRWYVVQDYRSTEAQRLREDGIRQAAHQYGATVLIDCVLNATEEEEVADWLQPKLQSAMPDGIFATSSLGAVGALLACDKAGLDVPDQVCIVGCDASVWRLDPRPRITSIEVSWYEAGRQATDLLLRCRDGGAAGFGNVLLEPCVVEGATCPVGPKVRIVAGPG